MESKTGRIEWETDCLESKTGRLESTAAAWTEGGWDHFIVRPVLSPQIRAKLFYRVAKD